MMRLRLLFIVSLFAYVAYSQKNPEDFGFIHKTFQYKNNNVDVLIRCKPGEENIKKPLLLFCQGSQPVPLIKYDERGLYNVFPFDEKLFLDNYHLVIINKPGIPVIADISSLSDNMYKENGKFTAVYMENNHPEFYSNRNNFILKQLLKEDFASSKQLVVIGHSEGSTIAAWMAASNKKITHIVYASGNPYGRIASIIERDRHYGQNNMEYWKEVVANKNELLVPQGDSPKTTYDFSIPVVFQLLSLKIPVMISYGLKDWSASHNDLFQIETIRNKKSNITFNAYPGLEHNFYPVDEQLNPDYNVYNWDKVAADWANWLKS
jgi:hypothetical protein